METVDTLINAGWVVPVEPDCSALADHSVAIRDGRIEAVLPTAETAGRYQAMEVIDRPGHVVLPGFVNAHTHAAMTLLRGLADDLPLMEWLEGHIWPAEAAWVGTEFVSDGVELGHDVFRRHVFLPRGRGPDRRPRGYSGGARHDRGRIPVELRRAGG
jgi:5-methylthioadenosine/S-adenosylhomocysteine deaminase